jgi:Protein of unknown function (DUF3297)
MCNIYGGLRSGLPGLKSWQTCRYGTRMTDTIPDRLSIDPESPHFHAEALQRSIGIRFKGIERRDVEEYSITEGWIRVQAGKTVDRRGKPLTLKLNGPVEAWFQHPAEGDTASE